MLYVEIGSVAIHKSQVAVVATAPVRLSVKTLDFSASLCWCSCSMSPPIRPPLNNRRKPHFSKSVFHCLLQQPGRECGAYGRGRSEVKTAESSIWVFNCSRIKARSLPLKWQLPNLWHFGSLVSASDRCRKLVEVERIPDLFGVKFGSSNTPKTNECPHEPNGNNTQVYIITVYLEVS